jgi:small-conductance mechanosensitive channel
VTFVGCWIISIAGLIKMGLRGIEWANLTA